MGHSDASLYMNAATDRPSTRGSGVMCASVGAESAGPLGLDDVVRLATVLERGLKGADVGLEGCEDAMFDRDGRALRLGAWLEAIGMARLSAWLEPGSGAAADGSGSAGMSSAAGMGRPLATASSW